MLAALFNEFKSSIKSPDTEEKLDLVLYRPIGYLIAKLANLFSMTPTMLSLMGLYFGIMSAYYYLDPANSQTCLLASFFLILSGIFDSADGQLARISNQSSKFGLVIDGICDSLVTIAIYGACAWPYIIDYGFFFVVLVGLSLHLHSCQCAIVDFYHREYLYFGYGKIENDTYWNPAVKDAELDIVNSTSWSEKILGKLRLTWVKKQQFLTTRSQNERTALKKYLFSCEAEERAAFMRSYKEHNLWLLPFWRLVGVNAHTVLIIAFMFFNRFDLYLFAIDIVLLNLIILGVGQMQKRADRKLFAVLNLNE